MVTVHLWVGSILVLAYIVLTIANGMQISGTRTFAWTRQLSMGAAGLLLVQIVLGFNLLAGDHSINGVHYLFALAAIATVGFEHAKASTEPEANMRARMLTFATAGTTALILIAYAIGQSN